MKVKKIIETLFKEAVKALEEKEVPVSALIVDKDGNIISKARNNRQRTNNLLGHAEILAIQKAEKKIKDWRLNGYSLFVTLAPCQMCQEVIREARLDHVFYFCDSPSDKRKSIKMKKVSLEKSDLEKFTKLLTSFFDNMR